MTFDDHQEQLPHPALVRDGLDPDECGECGLVHPGRKLPRDEHDVIITSASFGDAYLVRITYNRDADGTWIDDVMVLRGTERPITLHGPFADEAEADAWLQAYPDDTDVADMDVITFNLVRPKENP